MRIFGLNSRKQLKRSSVLNSSSSLGGGGQLIPLKSLSAKKRLKARSEKMKILYEEQRIPFVIRFLEDHQWCEARWEGCMGAATEVNELVPRARGGSILDPSNCCALCHSCHLLITSNPKRAHATGFALRYDPSPTEVDDARKKRALNA